jgi:nitroreductase
MDLIDAIRGRRAARNFEQNREIAAETLKQLVEYGTLAPSLSNTQPWVFIIVQRRIQLLFAVTPGMMTVPSAAIVICTDRARMQRLGWPPDIAEACSVCEAMAAQNIMLAAFGQGINSCPTGSFDSEIVATALNLRAGLDPQLIITLGYNRTALPMPPREPLESVIEWS